MSWWKKWLLDWLHPLKDEKPKREEKPRVFVRLAFAYSGQLLWALGSNIQEHQDGSRGGTVTFDEIVCPRSVHMAIMHQLANITRAKHNHLHIAYEDGLVTKTYHFAVLNSIGCGVTVNGLVIIDNPSFMYCGEVDRSEMRLHLTAV